MKCFLQLVMVVTVLITMNTSPAWADDPAVQPSESVTITLLRNGPPDLSPLGWSASGAFSDAGGWTIDRFICGACPAPTEGAANFMTTEIGTQGTLQIQTLSEFNQSQEQNLWHLTGGTGAYAKLRGYGVWTLLIDDYGVRHIICTGKVHSE